MKNWVPKSPQTIRPNHYKDMNYFCNYFICAASNFRGKKWQGTTYSYLCYGLSYRGLYYVSQVRRSIFCFMKFFRGQNLKIQTSFDLIGLKKGSAKYFENNLKSQHFFQGLIWRINLWYASKCFFHTHFAEVQKYE